MRICYRDGASHGALFPKHGASSAQCEARKLPNWDQNCWSNLWSVGWYKISESKVSDSDLVLHQEVPGTGTGLTWYSTNSSSNLARWAFSCSHISWMSSRDFVFFNTAIWPAEERMKILNDYNSIISSKSFFWTLLKRQFYSLTKSALQWDEQACLLSNTFIALPSAS